MCYTKDMKKQSINEKFSERFIYLIQSRNISTKDLINELSTELEQLQYDGKLPIQPQLIASWKNNTKPNEKVIQALINIFHIPEDYFFNDEFYTISTSSINNKYFVDQRVDSFKNLYNQYPNKIPSFGVHLLNKFNGKLPVELKEDEEFEFNKEVEDFITSQSKESFKKWKIEQSKNYISLLDELKWNGRENHMFVREFYRLVIIHKEVLETLQQLDKVLRKASIYKYHENIDVWVEKYIDQSGNIKEDFIEMIAQREIDRNDLKRTLMRRFPSLIELENIDYRTFFKFALKMMYEQNKQEKDLY